jgi:diguanylate cyclase (GGDEF)-like protein
MISILNSVNDLDRCHELWDLVLDCYRVAIKNIAHYSIPLEEEVSAQHREYLAAIVGSLDTPTVEVLHESRATLRGLLRDYRDKTSQYLQALRDELSGTARALGQIMDALGQSEGDHDVQLRNALTGLRTLPLPPGSEIRAAIQGAAKTIEISLDQVRKQHKLTVAQFLVEVRMLHKRIDSLESAACVDGLTKLFTRAEMTDRIKAMEPGAFCLLLLKVNGFKAAQVQYSPEIGDELAGAFSKRLRNSLLPTTAIGRWNLEEFMAVLHMDKTEASAVVKNIAEHLGGSYACLLDGKTVRPAVHLRVALMEKGSETMERLLERVDEFLTGR